MLNKMRGCLHGDSFCVASFFAAFFLFYIWLAWLVSGGDTWWILDVVNGTNVYYGDDAYRFFIARSAWIDSSLYTYNFVLPVALVLDGVVVWLTSGDLFGARVVHGLLASASLCLIWQAGRTLDLSRLSMSSAVIIMALIPRYSFTALSFYGEAWLAFAISLSLWFFAKKHFALLAVVASLLPLIRPEGIYFLVSIAAFLFLNRRIILSVAAFLPGLLYLIFLLVVVEPFNDYQQWRMELALILSKIPFNVSRWEVADAFSPLFLLVSSFAFLSRRIRLLWPFWMPAFIWVIFLQVLVLQGMAKFEERYLCGVIPVLIIFFGASLTRLEYLLCRWTSRALFVRLNVFALSALVATQGLGSMNALVDSLSNRELLNSSFNSILRNLRSSFVHHDHKAMHARHEMVNKIYELIEKDVGIRLLIIQDPFLYYMLDPARVPSDIVVGYPATTYMIFHLLLDGQIFVQHSRGRRFSYIRFGEPDYSDGEQRALYVDLMPMTGYPHTWRFNGVFYELYLLSYLESFRPEVDIAEVQPISPAAVSNAWLQWELRKTE